MKSKYVMICLLCFIAVTHAWRDYKPQIKQQFIQNFAKIKPKQQNISFIIHPQNITTISK